MKKKANILDNVVAQTRQAFGYVFLFSMASNFLMLIMPIFTLQVLDRVISSRSMETLGMLAAITVFLLIAFGLFQAIRSVTLVRIGQWFDDKLSSKILASSIATAAHVPNAASSQGLRDLSAIKNFLTGPGLSSLFDAPWSIVYFLVLFLISPTLCLITLIGGVALIIAALINEKAVKNAMIKANEQNIRSMNQVDHSARNAEVIEAMGMMEPVVDAWQKNNQAVLESQSIASNRSGVITSAARAIRMIQQVAIMGVGAYLAINNHITVGGIIACSILGGRALAPFEGAMGAWQSITSTRQSYERLRLILESAPIREESISLPRPDGKVSVERAVYAPPGSNATILKGLSFELPARDILGVIGPSAAGKSTLAKLLVGVHKPNSGNVRLDGADVYSWKRSEFGKYVGYLPQDVELFEGTVRSNISRMQPDVSDEDIIEAGKLSGAHDMILHLPNGYDTEIGFGGSNLSAGQRQRVGLARAFFGKPRMVVLDEPNSNLDEAGEAALLAAIKSAKNSDMTVIIIAHRPSVLQVVDKILVMKDGAASDFGAADEMLAKYTRGGVQQQAIARLKQAQHKAQSAQQQPNIVQQANVVQPQVTPIRQDSQASSEKDEKEAAKVKKTTKKIKNKTTKVKKKEG